MMRLLPAVLVLLLVLAGPGRAADSASAAADDALARGDYSSASAAFQKLIAAGVDLAHSWFELGVSQQHLKQYDLAKASYGRALQAGFAAPYVNYQLARIAAVEGRTDAAFEYLQKMGFVPEEPFRAQADFAGLPKDRVAALFEAQRSAQHPCTTKPEYRALDFWIGDWKVQGGGGVAAGTSHIELIGDQCVIFENWTGTVGDVGKSLTHYDTSSRKWVQYYVSQTSLGTLWEGNVSGDSIVFYNRSGGRMTLTKLSDGRVRHRFETRTNGVWAVRTDLIYSKGP